MFLPLAAVRALYLGLSVRYSVQANTLRYNGERNKDEAEKFDITSKDISTYKKRKEVIDFKVYNFYFYLVIFPFASSLTSGTPFPISNLSEIQFKQ